MYTARFTFLPDLNNFLAPDRREGSFGYAFEQGQSVKHLIEAAGVPHTEIGPVVVNGRPIGFEYQVQGGDQVTVFPAKAENEQPGEIHFVLDNHLGRLAAYLRMLGFDVVYRNDFDDAELAQIAANEERILLTRDRRLLMRKAVRHGYCLRSLDSREQAIEVLLRYNLFQAITPFRRCLRCNTLLERISKEAIIEHLEPLTKRYYKEFHHCPACGQIYWKGSHYEHMQLMIEAFQARQDTGN
jgi:uncharacterized protein with PIN domain